MRVYVDCVGCEQRKIDAQRIINYLKINKIEVSDSPINCDFAVLVTCGVDRASQRASLLKLRKLLSDVNTKVIVGGCLPSLIPQLSSDPRIYASVRLHGHIVLDKIFKCKTPIIEVPRPNRTTFDKIDDVTNTLISPRQEYERAKSGFKIVINDGCLLSCSYCSIRKATGSLKSSPLEEIIKQSERANASGESTIMLMGGDTGAYGRDIGLRFHDLLMRLLDVEGSSQLFIHDFNINWLIEEVDRYLDLFRRGEQLKIVRGITFPIQSGSDRILKMMKRPYCSADSIGTIKQIREISPSLLIGTHIIVGFPTESIRDFRKTIRLLKECQFDFVSCFIYSDNPGTDSYRIQKKVPQKIATDRARELTELLGNKIKIYGV